MVVEEEIEIEEEVEPEIVVAEEATEAIEVTGVLAEAVTLRKRRRKNLVALHLNLNLKGINI